MVARRLALLLFTVLMTHTPSTDAQTVEPIRHTLRFPAPQTNRLEVSSVVPTGQRADVDLMMAVWTPGSYLVREYSRNVEDFEARGRDGRLLPVTKSSKNRWRIATGGSASITVTYQVYAREMTPRHDWVDASFALVNGAPTFMTIAGDVARPHEVTIEPAAGWTRSITAMPEIGGRVHTYRAASFDVLVDSPILIGNPDVREFRVDGKPHVLVTEGAGDQFDSDRAARDLERLTAEHRKMWGSLPFDKYVFFNMMTYAPGQPGGALEHSSSVLMMNEKAGARTRQGYNDWLELASHEYFHVWNVKRLRPVELGPFDYEREVFTRSLWVVEGVTDYYGELALRRAGFITNDEYLQSLSTKIEALQNTPGRYLQSLEQSSFDTWIRQYRPDENSVNVAISYYTKGHIVAWLLDAVIRRQTNGARSLDDVMRAAYAQYSGAKGYTPDEFRAIAESVAGMSLRDFWRRAVEGTEELDYGLAMSAFGLTFRSVDSNDGRPWLGAGLRNDAGRLVVTQVRSDGPAFMAGLNVDDEILGVDEVRVRADRFDARLAQYAPGARIALLVVRREELLRLPVTLGTAPVSRWRLEVDRAPSEAQRAAFSSWLTG